MKKLYSTTLMSLSLMVATLMSLPSCKSYQVATQPIEVQAPDSLPDPLPTSGWEFARTSPLGGVYLPRQQPVGKVKHSYNTETKQKDSNNTGSNNKKSGNADSYNDQKKQGQQQDVGNVKQKGRVVGDGNTVKEGKSLWWLWVLVAGLLVAAWFNRKALVKLW